MLAEASYTEDTEAVVGEIETFAMENGAEAKSIEVVSGGVCYRYYFISGDSFSLCVTAQCPGGSHRGQRRAHGGDGRLHRLRGVNSDVLFVKRETFPFRFFIGSTLIPAPNHAIMDGKRRERP